MAKHLILRSFAWTAVFTTLFVLLLGTMLISLVVGDWVYLHTENVILSWTIGIFILFGFLASMGTGIGLWLWLRNPNGTLELDSRNDTMDILLKDSGLIDQD